MTPFGLNRALNRAVLLLGLCAPLTTPLQPPPAHDFLFFFRATHGDFRAVSYTHLTLPTILLV